MKDRLVKKELSQLDFKIFIAKEFNILYNDLTFEFIDFIIKYINDIENNKIEIVDNTHNLLDDNNWTINNEFIKVNIDVDSLVWTVIALYSDIKYTAGGATALLNGLGKIKKFIHMLDVESGEVCNLNILADKLNSEGSADDIIALLANKKCIYKTFGCIHKKNYQCSINKQEVENNMLSLISKNVVLKKEMQWIIID